VTKRWKITEQHWSLSHRLASQTGRGLHDAKSMKCLGIFVGLISAYDSGNSFCVRSRGGTDIDCWTGLQGWKRTKNTCSSVHSSSNVQEKTTSRVNTKICFDLQVLLIQWQHMDAASGWDWCVLCSRVISLLLQTSKLNRFLMIFTAALLKGQFSNLNKKGDKS